MLHVYVKAGDQKTERLSKNKKEFNFNVPEGTGKEGIKKEALKLGKKYMNEKEVHVLTLMTQII